MSVRPQSESPVPVSSAESMTSSASALSLNSSPVTMAELEFADHLAQKIRVMNAKAPVEPSDDALQLREQAFHTMQELQQGIHTSDNPYGIAADMLAVKHAMFDACFKELTQQLVNAASTGAPLNPAALSEIVMDLNGSYQAMFLQYQQISAQAKQNDEQLLQHVHKQLEDVAKEASAVAESKKQAQAALDAQLAQQKAVDAELERLRQENQALREVISEQAYAARADSPPASRSHKSLRGSGSSPSLSPTSSMMLRQSQRSPSPEQSPSSAGRIPVSMVANAPQTSDLPSTTNPVSASDVLRSGSPSPPKAVFQSGNRFTGSTNFLPAWNTSTNTQSRNARLNAFSHQQSQYLSRAATVIGEAPVQLSSPPHSPTDQLSQSPRASTTSLSSVGPDGRNRSGSPTAQAVALAQFQVQALAQAHGSISASAYPNLVQALANGESLHLKHSASQQSVPRFPGDSNLNSPMFDESFSPNDLDHSQMEADSMQNTDPEPQALFGGQSAFARVGDNADSELRLSVLSSGPSAEQVSPPTGSRAPPKKLTVSALNTFIEEMYIAKEKFDLKCAQLHLPRETMAEYLNTFLVAKYGLKSLVASHRDSILHAVDAFWPESNDVLVFRKIFCHELDEKFPRVQQHLKQTTQDLLKALIKRQNMLKPEAAIASITVKKVKGYLLAIEWQDIIKFLYPDEVDREHITSIVRKMLDAQASVSGLYSNQSMRGGLGSQSLMPIGLLDQKHMTMFSLPSSLTQQTVAAVSRRLAAQQAESIRYSDFLEILLTHQLSEHERFLSRYVQTFHSVDADHCGLLTQQQFLNALEMLYPNAPVTCQQLFMNCSELIDPFSHNRISFSQAVEFLTSSAFLAIQPTLMAPPLSFLIPSALYARLVDISQT